MGMYDEVVFDPEVLGLPTECRQFQTKSLLRCLDRYRVTKDGRLYLAGTTLFDGDPQRAAAAVAEEQVDMNFHGDLQLRASAPDYEEYVARFTHGRLEWVKPLETRAASLRTVDGIPVFTVGQRMHPNLVQDTVDAIRDERTNPATDAPKD